MKKHSKRFNNLKALIKNKNYYYRDAISLLKKIANANFIESAEIHFSLNIKLVKLQSKRIHFFKKVK